MPPFKFRLEQVRLYRKQLEEQAMQALAAAVMRRDGLKERITRLEKERAAQLLALSRADALDAAERWLATSYVEALARDIKQAVQDLAQAEELVDERRVELVEKAKDRGLLDSLKEKQAERHLLLERQEEQRTNDETATLRYKPAAL